MNSIIEAQITLQEEVDKEIDRCKDDRYFFENYWIINGKKAKIESSGQITFKEIAYKGIELAPTPIFKIEQ